MQEMLSSDSCSKSCWTMQPSESPDNNSRPPPVQMATQQTTITIMLQQPAIIILQTMCAQHRPRSSKIWPVKITMPSSMKKK